MKWLRLQGSRAESSPPRRSAAASIALRGAAWAAFLAVFIVLGRRTPSGDASPGRRAAASARADSAVQQRLEQLLVRAKAEGYGVELSLEELRARWRAGEASLRDETADALAADLGLPKPRSMPLGPSEAATRGKCLREGAWVYGSLPARPEAGVECWSLALDDGPRRWLLQRWQPRRKVWSSYEERDLRRAWESWVRASYSGEREDALRDAASRAIPLAPETRRGALLEYYGFLAEADGARTALRRL